MRKANKLLVLEKRKLAKEVKNREKEVFKLRKEITQVKTDAKSD